VHTFASMPMSLKPPFSDFISFLTRGGCLPPSHVIFVSPCRTLVRAAIVYRLERLRGYRGGGQGSLCYIDTSRPLRTDFGCTNKTRLTTHFWETKGVYAETENEKFLTVCKAWKYHQFIATVSYNIVNIRGNILTIKGVDKAYLFYSNN